MGIGPVLLLLRIDSNGLGSMEPVAGSVLPHAVGTVGYIPAIFHPAGHCHTEMQLYVIVQDLVVLGGVWT